MAEKNPDVAQVGKLRWLHLSDIHFSRSSDWCDEAARKKLIKMLKTEFDAGRLPKPDCIFCTGDIAQGAATQQEMNAQYASAQTFFDDVLKACGLNKDRLFVVPGNHDVRRTAVSQNYQNGLLASTLPAIKSDWTAANGEFKAAIARLAEYGQFTQSYLPHQAAADPDGRHCYARVVNINSIRIGIAGFNSAWSCHGVTDQNRLWMAAEWQFNAADDVFDDATDLRIGLMHHPASWLNTAEETLMKQRVRDGFQFWLHGHEHQAWVTPTDREIVICAGAVNAKSDPEFGINLVDLDLVKGTGQVHLFAYQTGGNAWLIKPDGDAPRGVRDIAFAKVAQTVAIQMPETLTDEPVAPAAIQPDDTARIAQARQAILDCLHRDYFDGIPRLEFAPDGLPQVLADAFADAAADCAADINQSLRVLAADNSIYAILKFAREFVDCFAELPAAAPVATTKSKEQYWKRLVNAMQHAIILSAKKGRRIDDAYRADAPVAMEGMSWLTASVLLRASLADSLRTNPDNFDAMADPLEDGHAASWGVEIGTGDAAKLEIYNIIRFLINKQPFEAPPTPQEIDKLKGQARLRQREKTHLLIMNDKTAYFPPQLIKWLNTEMFVGHITILEGNGEFDLAEGIWRACLEELLDVMRAFEPKHIRPRIMK
jgi:predicted phosphodiesterase